MTATSGLETLPVKTASFIVNMNCAFRDPGRYADIAGVNPPSIQRRPGPSDSVRTGSKYDSIADLARTLQIGPGRASWSGSRIYGGQELWGFAGLGGLFEGVG